MKDFGYDVSNYCDVDPMFGTLADFDKMMETAHSLNLRVMIDLVLSHTSDQHPRVLIGGMRQHQINHHPQVQAVGSFHHLVEISQRAKHRVHVTVV